MRKRAAVAGSLILGIVMLIAAPAEAWTIFFADDFRGTSLDATVWNRSIDVSGVRWCASAGGWVDAAITSCGGQVESVPYGTIDEHGGEAHFSASRGHVFPYVWRGPPSMPWPIPATGDFKVKVLLRFNGPEVGGSGFVARAWPNSDPSGSNDPGGPATAVFAVWGDATGTRAYLLGQSVTVPDPTLPHSYKVIEKGGKYTLYVDESPALGPVASSARPNAFWIGNPNVTPTSIRWTAVVMDLVHVWTTP